MALDVALLRPRKTYAQRFQKGVDRIECCTRTRACQDEPLTIRADQERVLGLRLQFSLHSRCRAPDEDQLSRRRILMNNNAHRKPYTRDKGQIPSQLRGGECLRLAWIWCGRDCI